MSWACEFCLSSGAPLYTVNLGLSEASLSRCQTCGSCQITEPFCEDAIVSHYENEYFSVTPLELKKARVLARDYLKKVQEVLGTFNMGDAMILEVGAGYGFFANLLSSSLSVNVDVVEPSKAGRDFIRKTQARVRLKGCVLSDLPPGEMYDFVFCFHVAEHLQRFSPFLARLASVMRPGGIVMFLTPNADSSSFLRFGKDWGWSVPNQHYQLLSTRIPSKYYLSNGFELLHARDTSPASIHYPSRVHSNLQTGIRKVSTAIRRGHHPPAYLRAIRRAMQQLSGYFEQNRRGLGMLSLERAISRLFIAQTADELLLLLRRAASS